MNAPTVTVNRTRKSNRFGRSAGRQVIGLLVIAGLVATSLNAPDGAVAAAASGGTKPGAVRLLPSAKLVRPTPPMPNGDTTDRSRPSAAKAVRELVADRTETASTWQNSDGSRSVHQYLAPHFYRPSPKAGLTPIDTTVVPSNYEA